MTPTFNTKNMTNAEVNDRFYNFFIVVFNGQYMDNHRKQNGGRYYNSYGMAERGAKAILRSDKYKFFGNIVQVHAQDKESGQIYHLGAFI